MCCVASTALNIIYSRGDTLNVFPFVPSISEVRHPSNLLLLLLSWVVRTQNRFEFISAKQINITANKTTIKMKHFQNEIPCGRISFRLLFSRKEISTANIHQFIIFQNFAVIIKPGVLQFFLFCFLFVFLWKIIIFVIANEYNSRKKFTIYKIDAIMHEIPLQFLHFKT